MAEVITIELSNSEAQEFLKVGQALYPDATTPELREWAAVVAKNGLRSEVASLQIMAFEQDKAIEFKAEKDEFQAAWPVVPDPLGPPLPPDNEQLIGV